jgi:pilus assembly protein CpaF
MFAAEEKSEPYDWSGYELVSEPGQPEKVRNEVSTMPDRSLEEVKHKIHTELLKKIEPLEVNKLPEGRRRALIQKELERLIDAEAPLLSTDKRRQLLQELLDDILGFGPLEQLLRDPTISDILVNGANQVYVERHGVLEELPVRFRSNAHLLEIIHRIVAKVNRRVDESSPIVDARLLDGSRVNAIIPPLSLRGPSLSIRRFGTNVLHIKQLLGLRSFTSEMVEFMAAAVRARMNIIISGGTGSGKTTLLNSLSSFIPNTERIITIEDAAELQLQQRHVVQLEARPPNVEGKGQVTIRDLLRNSLRMRPNRIVIGECRGAEALDMLQAMNTGHDGSMTTLHANSPRDTISRLETMLMLAGLEIPLKAMREQIASAIDLIIQIDRLPGGARRITHITEVAGIEGDVITLQDIFTFHQQSVDASGRAFGEFRAEGIRPYLVTRIDQAGVHLPVDMFERRMLARV